MSWFGSHAPQPPIEALAAPASLEAYAAQTALVHDTAQEHGLVYGNTVLIGSAGLAAHGLYSHDVIGDQSGTKPMDGDFFLDEPTFARLQAVEGAESRPSHKPSEVHVPATDSTMPVDGLVTPLTDDFRYTFGASTFDEIRDQAQLVDGLLVLPAATLLRAKVGRGNAGDLIGALQAHYVAWATGHEVVNDARWQWDVLAARNSVQRRSQISRRFRRALPGWVGKLVANGFNEPAYDLNPDVTALGKAS